MFRYPIGAEVKVRFPCEFGEIHQLEGKILAVFEHESEPRYVVSSKAGVQVVDETLISGRVNVRRKNGAVVEN